MRIIAFDGSPRRKSNSGILMKAFLEKMEGRSEITYYKTDDLDLKSCRGCLMCNVLKHCAMRKDCWAQLSKEILESDIICFSTPIYFHHATSSMKKLLDRFRSFLMVQITEENIMHTTHHKWAKKIFLFTAHGSSVIDDALPLVDLFKFMIEILGPENEFNYINAYRLAVPEQIGFNEEQLLKTYRKLGLPERLVYQDLIRNAEWLATARRFAEELYVRY